MNKPKLQRCNRACVIEHARVLARGHIEQSENRRPTPGRPVTKGESKYLFAARQRVRFSPLLVSTRAGSCKPIRGMNRRRSPECSSIRVRDLHPAARTRTYAEKVFSPGASLSNFARRAASFSRSRLPRDYFFYEPKTLHRSLLCFAIVRGGLERLTESRRRNGFCSFAAKEIRRRDERDKRLYCFVYLFTK